MIGQNILPKEKFLIFEKWNQDGTVALRASLMQFEMREDGTIQSEWLE